MSASVYQRAAAPNRPALLWCAVALVAVAVVVSVVTFLALGAGNSATLTSLPSLGQGTVRAAALDERTIVAGTVDNQLIVWQDGQAISRIQTPYLANAITKLPDGLFAIGLVTGEVYVFDHSLQLSSSWKLPGRITGLAPRSAGGLTVTYGSGPASRDYRVEHYDLNGMMQGGVQVGNATRDLVAIDNQTFFVNARGEIGSIDPSGQEMWRELSQQGLNSAAADPISRQIFTGDVRGGVARIDPDGNTLWYRTLTEYTITAMYALPNGEGVVAGAEDGSIFALDADGNRQFGQRQINAMVAALVPTSEDRLEALLNDGSRIGVNISSLSSANTTAALQLAGYILAGVLLLTGGGFAIAGFGRSRRAVAQTSRQMYRARLAYALLAPAMILTLLFTYYPAMMAFYISFTNFSLSKPIEFVGFRNFVLMTSDPFLIAGIKNMFILLITNLIKSLTIPLLVAELIFWIRSERIRYWFRTAFVFPAIVPGIVAMLLWKTIWAPNIGLVNQVLKTIGLAQYQRAWLGEEATALWAIIFTGFPWIDIFAFLIFFGGLLAISGEIFDAASVDGANWVKRFWSIDLPALRPQLMLILFFTFIGSIQGFAGIFVLTGGGPGTATYVPALEMYLMISKASEFGYASAIGFALTAVVAVLVFLRLRFDAAQSKDESYA